MNLQTVLIFWELSGGLEFGTCDMFAFDDLLFELLCFVVAFLRQENLLHIRQEKYTRSKAKTCDHEGDDPVFP